MTPSEDLQDIADREDRAGQLCPAVSEYGEGGIHDFIPAGVFPQQQEDGATSLLLVAQCRWCLVPEIRQAV